VGARLSGQVKQLVNQTDQSETFSKQQTYPSCEQLKLFTKHLVRTKLRAVNVNYKLSYECLSDVDWTGGCHESSGH
jgi:hypothetical protein